MAAENKKCNCVQCYFNEAKSHVIEDVYAANPIGFRTTSAEIFLQAQFIRTFRLGRDAAIMHAEVLSTMEKVRGMEINEVTAQTLAQLIRQLVAKWVAEKRPLIQQVGIPNLGVTLMKAEQAYMIATMDEVSERFMALVFNVENITNQPTSQGGNNVNQRRSH